MTSFIGKLDEHQQPDLTIIVVNFNTGHLLEDMFTALVRSQGSLTVQVIIVDNASTDGSAEILRTRFSKFEVIENQTNVGFGRANNQALKNARGKYILLLNTDAFVGVDTLQVTVAFMEANLKYGILGVKLVGIDGAPHPSCRHFPTPFNMFLDKTDLSRFLPLSLQRDEIFAEQSCVRDCDWVPGCYYLCRGKMIDEIGLFDHRYFLYFEEVDHCRAARNAGWSVAYYPFTRVVHLGGASAQSLGKLTEAGRQVSDLQIESQLLYFRKHHGFFGLIAAVALGLLTDLIIAAKSIIRSFRLRRVVDAWLHSLRMISVLKRTRFGSRPTR